MVLDKPKILKDSSLMMLVELRSSIFLILDEMNSPVASSVRIRRRVHTGIYVASEPKSMNFDFTYITWYSYVLIIDMQVKQSWRKRSSLIDMLLSKDRVNNSINFVLLLIDLIIDYYDSS
jgi:hypothetical protein